MNRSEISWLQSGGFRRKLLSLTLSIQLNLRSRFRLLSQQDSWWAPFWRALMVEQKFKSDLIKPKTNTFPSFHLSKNYQLYNACCKIVTHCVWIATKRHRQCASTMRVHNAPCPPASEWCQVDPPVCWSSRFVRCSSLKNNGHHLK